MSKIDKTGKFTDYFRMQKILSLVNNLLISNKFLL